MTPDTPDVPNRTRPPAPGGEAPVVAPPSDEQPLATSQLGSGGLAQQHTSETQPAIAVLKVCPHCGTEYETAARFCPAFEEQRQYFRAQARSSERVSLAERRRRFQERWTAVMAELVAA